jgi:hypothetical protein
MDIVETLYTWIKFGSDNENNCFCCNEPLCDEDEVFCAFCDRQIGALASQMYKADEKWILQAYKCSLEEFKRMAMLAKLEN